MKFAFKEGGRLSGDAQAVGAELEKIREESNGVVLPEVVVSRAKDESSPLHRYFEWDDSKAAQQYRLEQARNLLRHIIVVENGDKTPRRAFIVTSVEGDNVYMDTADAMRDPNLRSQILKRAAGELASFERKYAELEELAGVIAVAAQTRAAIQEQLNAEQARSGDGSVAGNPGLAAS